MSSSLKSLIATGTKLWLDSIDPVLVAKNRALGASGATSNPIIVSDILKCGTWDKDILALAEKGLSDEEIAWTMTDRLVGEAQKVFLPVSEQTKGNDGWVSFELDPLIEDTANPLPHAERVKRYIELGKKWSAGHKNRMIKVPATPAGLEAVEHLAAHGITLNVTLIFSERQYKIARDNVWKGAQRRPGGLDSFKSVYSIFVSRVDVYTENVVPTLSKDAQGLVGILNVKRLWKLNQEFWASKGLKLQQEIIFASTGAKKMKTYEPAADKYVAALAGSDIQTNPPATNDAVEALGHTYTRKIDELPSKAIQDEIDRLVDQAKMEETLMSEGLAKFADPHKKLLETIKSKRATLVGAK
jgi:transaldolase